MRGFFSINIPTKPYIKAYIRHRMGPMPIMDRSTHIGKKLYDLLDRSTNEDRLKFSPTVYKTDMKVYVSARIFRIRGCNLNETNIQAFNAYLEDFIKEQFYFTMDIYTGLFNSFEGNLPTIRKAMGIEEEDWATDSMKKDYYRYRKRTGKPLLYKKKFSENVPSEKLFHSGL